MLRILIADDHSVVRQGLERILRKEYPSAAIESVSDADNLIKKVMKSEWDLIISDLSMPGTTGMEAISQIKDLYPKLPVLILTMHSEEQYALRALKAGASGYLSKNMAPEELIDATRRVLIGRKYITSTLAEKLSDQMTGDYTKMPHELLSDREFEVMKLLASGRSLTEIGQILSISPVTVSTYRRRILEKMQLSTNADLTKYVISTRLDDEI